MCCVCTEAARFVYEICLALAFLHTNDIAHRDLKVTCLYCVTKDVFVYLPLVFHLFFKLVFK